MAPARTCHGGTQRPRTWRVGQGPRACFRLHACGTVQGQQRSCSGELRDQARGGKATRQPPGALGARLATLPPCKTPGCGPPHPRLLCQAKAVQHEPRQKNHTPGFVGPARHLRLRPRDSEAGLQHRAVERRHQRPGGGQPGVVFNHHRLRHHCRGAGGEETAGGCGRDGSRACRDEGPAEGPSQRLWHSRDWQSVRRRNRAAEEAHPGWQVQAPVAPAEVGAVAQAGRRSAARLSLRAPDTSTLCTPGMPPSTLCTSGTSMGQQMPAANTLVVRSAAALAGAAGRGGRPPPAASSASAPAVEVGPSTSRPCCSLGEPGVRLPRGRGREGQARWGGVGRGQGIGAGAAPKRRYGARWHTRKRM